MAMIPKMFFFSKDPRVGWDGYKARLCRPNIERLIFMDDIDIAGGYRRNILINCKLSLSKMFGTCYSC